MKPKTAAELINYIEDKACRSAVASATKTWLESIEELDGTIAVQDGSDGRTITVLK